MTPFLAFNLWIRRAPTSKRASAALAAALAVALFVWLLVPTSGPSSSANAESSQAGGVTKTTGAVTSSSTSTTVGGIGSGSSGTSAGSASGGGGTTGGATAPGASGSSAGATGAHCPSGSDQGVSANQMKVAITIANVAGPTANSAFGVPSPSQQQSDYQAVINNINAAGGAGCRKIVPLYVTDNPADPSNLQQTCLSIVQAGVFAAIDSGTYDGFSALAECYPQHQIPFFTIAPLPSKEQQQFYPYLFGAFTLDTLNRNTVLALNSRGFFNPSNGFKTLGFIYQDCIPSLVSDYTSLLQQIGLSSSQIVTYDVGCPGTFASPNILLAAIAKFKAAGVTNLTEVQDLSDFDNFTTIAQSQGFDPKWGIPDENFAEISGSGSLKPDYSNIANAVAIDPDRWGEESTPGYAPTPGTAKCNAILQGAGQPPVYQQGLGFGGWACDNLWELTAAADQAPTMQRTALAAGLQAAGSIDYSYPLGPNNFSGSNVTDGGEFWRPIGFSESCSCWQVLSPTFSPSL